MPSTGLTFPRNMRLSFGRDFRAVYDAAVRVSSGPLLVYTLPSHLPRPRLGLSVPRRVGTAVMRNAIKRRLREAFRLLQRKLPSPKDIDGGAYDVVVSVRPHQPLALPDYQRILLEAVNQADAVWQKKRAKPVRPSADPALRSTEKRRRRRA